LIATGAEVLGGKNVECTVLFSDIRGFTTLTEQLGAQGTVALLNEYFTLMVDCIQKEGGMLDKFIGDAIMAEFGIPEGHEDDADRAVRAAIDMIKTLETWNSQRISEGKLPVNIGIGLNTDYVVSGNIGSEKRMDFTIIGDGANLASRLESACKQYGTRILVSDSTVQKLQGTYRKREIDLVVVKGQSRPVSIHEILAFHTEESFPGIGEVMGLYKDGLSAYRARKWDAAIRLFGECLAINPNDKPSQLYIGRAEHLKDNPPPDDWAGVWVMTSK
jgi:adenylate cyclase